MESANNVCEHFVFSALSHFAIHLYAKQELFTSGSRDRHQYNLFRFIVPILMQDMPFWSFRNDISFFWCSVFSKTSAAVIKRSRKQSIPWLDMTIHPLFGAVSFSLMILLITTPQIPIRDTPANPNWTKSLRDGLPGLWRSFTLLTIKKQWKYFS